MSLFEFLKPKKNKEENKPNVFQFLKRQKEDDTKNRPIFEFLKRNQPNLTSPSQIAARETMRFARMSPDEAKEFGKKFALFGRDVLQGTARGVFGVGMDLGRGGINLLRRGKENDIPFDRSVMPKTKIEKAIFGDEPIYGAGEQSRQLRSMFTKGEAKQRPLLDIPLGFVLSASDFFTGGGKQQAVRQSALQISKLNKADDIVPALKNILNGSDKEIQALAKNLELTTSPFDVLKEVKKFADDANSGISFQKGIDAKKIQQAIDASEKISLEQIKKIQSAIDENKKAFPNLKNLPITSRGAKNIIENIDQLIPGLDEKKVLSGDWFKKYAADREAVEQVIKNGNGAKLLHYINDSAAEFSEVVNAGRSIDEIATAARNQAQTASVFGRSLAFFKNALNDVLSASPEARVIQDLAKAEQQGKLNATLEEALNRLKMIDVNNVGELSDFYADLIKRNWWQKFNQDVVTPLRYTNMLLNPAGRVRDVISSALNTGFLRPVVIAGSSVLDNVHSILYKDKARKIYASQAGKYVSAYYGSLKKGWQEASNILRTGVVSNRNLDLADNVGLESKFTRRTRINYVTRGMEAIDAFFRVMAESGEMASITENLTRRGVVDLVPNQKVIDEARRLSVKSVFRQNTKEASSVKFNALVENTEVRKAITEQPNADLIIETFNYSSLEDFVNAKNVDNIKTQILDDLIQEARKYKSAEDFIESQPKLFHVSREKNIEKFLSNDEIVRLSDVINRENEPIQKAIQDKVRAINKLNNEEDFLRLQKKSYNQKDFFDKISKLKSEIEALEKKLKNTPTIGRRAFGGNTENVFVSSQPDVWKSVISDQLGIPESKLFVHDVFVPKGTQERTVGIGSGFGFSEALEAELPVLQIKTRTQLEEIWKKANSAQNISNIEELEKAWAQSRMYKFVSATSEQGVIGKTMDTLAGGLSYMRKDDPTGIISFIFPFITTPNNIFKQGIELLPGIGALDAIGRTDDIAKMELMTKQILGSVAATFAIMGAMEGKITWASPRNKKEREAFQEAGMRPYSVRLNDGTWLQYSQLGPSGYPLAMMASITNAFFDGSRSEISTLTEKISQSYTNIVEFMFDQSFVSGAGDLFAAATGDPRQANVPQTLGSMAVTQLNPLPAVAGPLGSSSLLIWANNVTDKLMRKRSNETLIRDTIYSIVPGMSRKLEVRRGLSGQAIEKTSPIMSAFLPLQKDAGPEKMQQLENFRDVSKQSAITSKKTKEQTKQVDSGLDFYFQMRDAQTKEEFDSARQDLITTLQVLKETDEVAYKKLENELKDAMSNLSPFEKRIKSMGVSNGERAEFIVRRIQDLPVNEQKQLIADWYKKGLITEDVLVQILQYSK